MSRDGSPSCIYCGRLSGDSRDHIPPRSLFPRPFPSDLITVPSCIRCNMNFSRDDEYFKTVVLMRQDVASQPAAQTALASILRNWRRPQSHRLRVRLLRSFFDVAIRSPAGLFLGTAPGYRVDNQRLRNTIARITSGLFYEVFGRSVAPGSTVTGSDWLALAPDTRRDFATMLSGARERTVADGVFTFRWVRARDNEDATLWIMTIYSAATFTGITAPPVRPGTALAV